MASRQLDVKIIARRPPQQAGVQPASCVVTGPPDAQGRLKVRVPGWEDSTTRWDWGPVPYVVGSVGLGPPEEGDPGLLLFDARRNAVCVVVWPADAVVRGSLLSGHGAPSAGLGLPGDFYFDDDTDTLYGPKAGAWPAGISLVAAPPTPPVPPGALTAFAAAEPPDGYLLCDGAAVSRTTYAALFAVIGTTYGAGDGSTTFNVPDLRGRVPVGVDGSANRLIANDALGNSGGTEKHTLTTTEMPSHSHTVTIPGVNGNGSVGTLWSALSGSGSYAYGTDAQGGGGAHNNMQPFQVVNWIVKT